MVDLKFYKMSEDVLDPKFGTEGSACFDLHAYLKPGSSIVGYTPYNKKIPLYVKTTPESTGFITIVSGDRILIPTGIIFDIPQDHKIHLYVRSSVALKKGLVLANSVGIIDEDYYHETFVMLHNISGNSVMIEDGERIAQAACVPKYRYSLTQTIQQPQQKTDRTGGFGSTGK